MKNKLDINKIDKNNFIDMLKSLPDQIDEIVNKKEVLNNYVKAKSDFS